VRITFESVASMNRSSPIFWRHWIIFANMRILFPGMIHCIFNQKTKTKFGNKEVCTVSGNKKVIDTFWPFPKQNKQTNNTTIITTNLERRGFDFIFKMLFASPKIHFHLNEVFVRSLNIILLPKQRISFQFRLTQLLCLVSSNRRRVVIFGRHQQHHVIFWNCLELYNSPNQFYWYVMFFVSN
jgi:hypothetical protein